MFERFKNRLRYGEDVVVVSGLPRSGTSMLMAMLEAGGLPLMTDNRRQPDADNPRGYFEMESVKSLGEQVDKTWVRGARGRGLKVISYLLKELPDDNFYRVLFARRDLAEVIRSQNVMLGRQNQPNPVDDAKALDLYRKHLVNVQVLMRTRRNFRMLEVAHRDTLAEPRRTADAINAFLGGRFDAARMAAVVDRELYRNRA
jgi:hypothetical protein